MSRLRAAERGEEVTKIKAKELDELGMMEAQLAERRKQLEHLTAQRRDALVARRLALTKEIEELDEAILALR